MKQKWKYKLIAWVSVLLGSISLLFFFHFVIFDSCNILKFDFNTIESIIFDICLLTLFFIQHSLMVRGKVRSKVEQYLPKETFFSFHCIFSSILLITIFLLWQKSHVEIFSINYPLRFLFNLTTIISICCLLWAILSLRGFDPFGRKQISNYLNSQTPPNLKFTIRGPYRWTRHPFYFFILLMIWAHPDVTVDRLIFAILWTMWVVLGTILEERDLANEIGDEYLDYKSKVPMLIPYNITKKIG